MLKKPLLFTVLFMISVFLSPAESDEGLFHIVYRSLTWNAVLTQDFPAGMKNTASDYLDENFVRVLSSSGIAILNDNAAGKELRYSFHPEAAEFEIIESQRSGYFFNFALDIAIENYSGSEGEKAFRLKALGSGRSADEALINSMEMIVDQFSNLVTGFEEWSESVRIVDVYQGTVIINTGKKGGLRKGGFLYSKENRGSYVVEKTDDGIAFARMLNSAIKPDPGDLLEAYDRFGISADIFTDFFSGDRFSGTACGASLIWTRGLYVFHPEAGVEILKLSDGSGILSDFNLVIPYAGFRIVRHINSFTLSSGISAGAGFLSGEGMEYSGGKVRASIEKRIKNRFAVSIAAGYSYMFPENIADNPDISGFFIGGGLGIRF